MKKNKKAVEKLEHDLSHFLIDELCKYNPTLRSSSEMYRYKGLSINIYKNEATNDNIFAVRISSLEAEFKVESGEKTSGALAPAEEQAIKIWLSQVDNNAIIKNLLKKTGEEKTVKIIPFDLEDILND